jgi:hypothetical protein
MESAETAAILIRIGVGIVQAVFGISQFKSPHKWTSYMPGLIRFILPVSPETFMRVHAMGNLALGILLLAGLWMPVTIWLALAWWIWILPFAFYKDFSIGMRDTAIIMSLIALLVLIR